jgi:hypothetical protein
MRMTTIAFIGPEEVPAAFGFGPLAIELRQRGFPSVIVRLPSTKVETPNRQSADAVVEALQPIHGEVAIVGVSHQGLYLPLIAAARPVRRLVYVNALIARPGRRFVDVIKEENVFAPGLLDATLKAAEGKVADLVYLTLDPKIPKWLRALIKWGIRGARERLNISGLFEPCPLTELPNVESVYVSGAEDQAVRPEWQQRAAREFLHVEPVILAGARHATALRTHRREIAEAISRGLRPADRRESLSLVAVSRNPTTGKFEEVPEVVTLRKFLRKRFRGQSLVSAAVPVLVYGLVHTYGSNLAHAVWSALGAAAAMVVYGLARGKPVLPALVGLLGVIMSAFVARLTGQARGFFLIGIWGKLVWASIFLLSVLLGRPLIGEVWSSLTGTGRAWRSDKTAFFYYSSATVVWVLVFAVHFVLEYWLYRRNAVEGLAIARIALGRPLAIVGLVVTVWAVRQASQK